MEEVAPKFTGLLSFDGKSAEVEFSAPLDESGAIKLAIDELPLTRDNSFILHGFDTKTPFPFFSLHGRDKAGRVFDSEHVHFGSVGPAYHCDRGSYYTFSPRCSKATFTGAVSPTGRPAVRLFLRGGFQIPWDLVEATDIGEVRLSCYRESQARDKLTNTLTIMAPDVCPDAAAWAAAAEKLLGRIREYISFAAGTNMTAPVRETYLGGTEVTTEVYEQSEQPGTQMPVFAWHQMEDFFSHAVAHAVRAPDQDLWSAIAWFVLPSVYAEQRLVNAMTALENLVDTLLPSKKKDLLTGKNYTGLVAAIAEFAKENLGEFDKLDEVEAKFTEFRRRPFYPKLVAMFENLDVPTWDIGEKAIRKAINGRNNVIHTGRYKGGNDPATEPGLWAHVTIIREIVSRIVLKLVGFTGKYTTFVGGCRDVEFPPKRPNEEGATPKADKPLQP
ncbi:conserved hypothetical protein [Magnetospirillum sp. LM-5]|uniref:hypothetical protein n=1 Tax=Magnetospirillum sp. LM-5 TaxID=2681466 RepID=UPI00137F1BCC|nr:hypothetical protein [Magnetospirillum sp. LM-5]CAA7624418.1 conserved hypothetical protein [Magnetospirillum sp. LM-5]